MDPDKKGRPIALGHLTIGSEAERARDIDHLARAEPTDDERPASLHEPR
jgi:hypothetical protein